MPASIFDILEQQAQDLLTLPGVAVQLIERCADPDVRIGDVVALIGSDQVMTARVLRMANSAFYGRTSSVSTLNQAVMTLGLETVRALGLSIGIYAALEPGKSDFKAELEQLWQHSIAVALSAREVARRIRSKDRERAFIAGLLHDIGQLVLVQCLADQYRAVLELLPVAGISLEKAERDVLGADHAEVGAWLLERWHLPMELRLPIALHLAEAIPDGDEPAMLLARIIQVSDWLATAQGLGGPWRESWNAYMPPSRADLPLDDDALMQLCLGLDKRVSQLCLAMELSPVSSDVCPKALYQANRALADMAVHLDSHNRKLRSALDALSTLQQVCQSLAASDDVRSMIESCAYSLCASAALDYVQCMFPLSADTVLLGTAEKGPDGVIRAEVPASTPQEWQHIQQLLAKSPLYRFGTFRLLDGTTGELVVRLASDPTGDRPELDLTPFSNILALALERAIAHRDLALLAERRSREAAKQATVTSEKEEVDGSDRRLRMLGEMAAGAAHDLNNALAVMLGQAQLGLIANDLEESRQYLSTIERTAKDCACTVRRLQEFARGARKQSKDDVFDLGVVARDTIEVTRPRWRDEAQKKGIHISVVVDVVDGLFIRGSGPALREVLTNLIFNAVDAMPVGGTLAIRGWAESGQVHLSVRDTGVGIPAEDKERIFEPFFTTKGDAGTGLGLTVCKRIVTEHSGRISVYSREGAGTTIMLSFPAASGQLSTKHEEIKPMAGRSLSVLVIDDEPEVREVLQRMLHLDGHSSSAASTAREGLEEFGKRPFDLVLTDLGLPDLPGWEVARTIKAISPATPVVLITGWTDEGDRPATGDYVDSVLVKPFGIAELKKAIAEAMRSSGTGHDISIRPG
ncbi:MAG: HDOD domain-containing protein [Anaerolineae bacterium]